MSSALKPELIAFLRCPESLQAVVLADEQQLGKINAKIAAGLVVDGREQRVSTPLSAALIREDKEVVFPIRDEIISMHPMDRILLASQDLVDAASAEETVEETPVAASAEEE